MSKSIDPYLDDIPMEIREAALLVGNWMKENGHEDWKLFDMQSRQDEPEPEIKPCPFCAGSDIRFTNHGKITLHRDSDVWSMSCYDCGATFPNRYRKAILVEHWNTRTPHDEVVNALREELLQLQKYINQALYAKYRDAWFKKYTEGSK